MSCWSRERRNGPYRTCICCHVRTATLCLGVYSLLVDILNICVILAIIIEPDLVPHNDNAVSPGIVTEDHSYMNNLSSVNNSSSYAIGNRILNPNDAQFIKLVVNFLTAFFATCLIYGTVKVRPSFLLPYFCIQLFDFCVSCLAVIGCFTNEYNVRIFFVMQEWFPVRNQMLALSSGWQIFIAGIIAIVYLWVKVYLINVVWKCYKYLVAVHGIVPATVRCPSDVERGQLLLPSTSQPSSIQTVTATVDPSRSTSDNAEMLLPPKYEDIATGMDQTLHVAPPPSYTDATAQPHLTSRTSDGSLN